MKQYDIDVSEHPSDYYLFEPRFLVGTIQLALTVIEETHNFSHAHTGDRAMDRDLQYKPARVWLNIDQMIKIIQAGYRTSLVNEQDSLQVYVYIQNHLDTAMRFLSGSMHHVKAPLDDLIALDKLADMVFVYARIQMGKDDTAPEGMIAGLSLSGMGENSIFKAAATKSLDQQAAASEDDGYPKRKPYAAQLMDLVHSGIEAGTYQL